MILNFKVLRSLINIKVFLYFVIIIKPIVKILIDLMLDKFKYLFILIMTDNCFIKLESDLFIQYRIHYLRCYRFFLMECSKIMYVMYRHMIRDFALIESNWLYFKYLEEVIVYQIFILEEYYTVVLIYYHNIIEKYNKKDLNIPYFWHESRFEYYPY